MSTNQDGVREKTPRRTTRRATATPVRDVSPPARGTRGGSTALQNTPATRRSTRGATRRSDQQPRDVVNNNVLPEVQTQQSYAYGSSKAPVLPEQLHVRDTMTMRQVADQMDSAINRAEQNLDTYAADLGDNIRQQQTQGGKGQTPKRGSKEPSPVVSVTTEVQKKQRTAAWASSLESGQLDDIAEEEQSNIDSPETRRTEPSSFPSGLFDQSYQYERGLRPPRRPPNPAQASFGSKLGSALGAVLDSTIAWADRVQQWFTNMVQSLGSWLSRLVDSASTALFELAESPLFHIMTKTLIILLATAFLSYALCFGFSRFLCDPSSTSKISQTLESWCGSCQSGRSYNLTIDSSSADIREFTKALKQIDSQIRSIESRINSRVDSKVSALYSDIDGLRREQSELVEQLEEVSSRASQQDHQQLPSASTDILSQVNYFSPANGAIVDPRLTSPTRQAPLALPLRLVARLLGINKYKAFNPVMALEPWHDVGDCWCAAASGPGQDQDQDRVRLGVSVSEPIVARELVIEHPPRSSTLDSGLSAPKIVELWADVGEVQQEQSPFVGDTWALLGTVEYDLEGKNNVQRFKFEDQQEDDQKKVATDYVVRVRETHGGEYGCLYRVRLHGVPAGQ